MPGTIATPWLRSHKRPPLALDGDRLCFGDFGTCYMGRRCYVAYEDACPIAYPKRRPSEFGKFPIKKPG